MTTATPAEDWGIVAMGEANSTTDSELSDTERLQSLNDTLAHELVPVVVYLSLFAIVGVMGNLITFYIFGFRLRMTTQHFLITVLAAFDLLQCFFSMPLDMYFMVHYVTSSNSAVCSTHRFASLICSTCSGLTLIAIAVDR
jgi:hypothetical protein